MLALELQLGLVVDNWFASKKICLYRSELRTEMSLTGAHFLALMIDVTQTQDLVLPYGVATL